MTNKGTEGAKRRSPKPSQRMVLDYAASHGTLKAWVTYRKKDGSGEHSGTIATNPEYVKVHKEWVWLPITLPKP